MDLPGTHSYQSILRSAGDEYELNDISEADHIPSQDEGDREGLLRDENSREEGPFVAGSKQQPFIKRAYSNLAHGHHHPKIGPLEKDAKRVAWKAGVRWVTTGAATILIINIAVTVFIVARYPISNGIATLYTGECTTVSWIDSGLHVTINLLSTAFLSASNYVMQVLNAPSRTQVDHFHARGESLHIGIPSFENAIRLGKCQTWLWMLLGISAIPLHLLCVPFTCSYAWLVLRKKLNYDTADGNSWNSAVFTTLQANQYNIFLVSSDFNSTDFACDLPHFCNQAQELHDLAKASKGLDYLDNAGCMEAYSVDFLTGRRNLLLVTNSTTALYSNGEEVINGTVFRVLESTEWDVGLNGELTWNPNQWWCQGDISVPVTQTWQNIVKTPTGCSLSEAMVHAANLEFNLGGDEFSEPLTIEYCLSESTPGLCQLEFTLYIMIIVILCNITKVASMVCSFWALTDEPLVIIGDALSSYLETPDANTEGCCLMEARDDLRMRNSQGKIWQLKKYRWFYAATTFSIVRCFFYCIISLIAAGYLLGMSLATLSHDFGLSFSSSQFGGVNAEAILHEFSQGDRDKSGFTTIASAVLLANSPQLLFSTLYFMYNRLLTSMLAMDEWSRFAYRSATLRVSYPSRGQRSTYWLHLPYAYGVPLLITTTVMHWLVSQSLFLARIQIYDADGNPYQPLPGATVDPTFSTPGYSPKSIVAAIALGGSMLLFLVGLGLRRYNGGIPLISNNSLAISAACHPPADDNDPAHSKVMWGAVAHGSRTSPGHCCLTSKPVTAPIVGNRYVGLRKGLCRPV